MTKDHGNQEDVLSYLPRRPLQEFARGQKIYDAQQPDDRLYVVMGGHVKLTSLADDGSQIVTRIVAAEGLFGESALLSPVRLSETAVALDSATLMAWSRSDIETQMEREPRFGVALIQYFARKSVKLQCRLQNIAVYKTPERVSLSLIQLAEELGREMPDGALRFWPLTHQMIAAYVGTSREIVSSQMNLLRRQGMIRYSRKYIDVYAAALRESLRANAIQVPSWVRQMYRVA